MKKFILSAIALLAIVAASSDSSAQQCNQPSLAQIYRSGYNANVQWPRIYIPPARRSICSTYAAMVNNGWRRQNLLGNYHFNQDTNALTDAGKLKVNWILSQAPVDRRNVFVQRSAKEVDTTARIAAVHEYAGNMNHTAGQAVVNDTHIVAEGHSARSVDSTFQAYQTINSQLPTTSPFLPTSSASSSSGQ